MKFNAGVVELENTAVFKTAALWWRLQVRTLPPASDQYAPVVVRATTGVEIRATEAAQTRQVHYRLLARAIQEGIAHDLPQLPDRM